MNRRNFLLTPALAAAAQSASKPQSLFDGRTLGGWTIEQGPTTAFYAQDGAIVVHESAGHPTWLRSQAEYENFDLRAEFFVKGWTDSGIYIHAPLHGRPTWEGVQIKLFHQAEEHPKNNSMGSLFPLIAPAKVNVRSKGEWNDIRIRMDWPRLEVWTNGEQIHDFNLNSDPEFRFRRRSGHIGLASLSYPIRFRNLTIQPLPSKEQWHTLYNQPSDFEQWLVSEGKPHFEALNEVLRGDGQGQLATREKFADFEFRAYIRHAHNHNSGVIFRGPRTGSRSEEHYEIQLHDVEDAHYPTGSLYHFKRAVYPRIQAEEWFPFYLRAQGPNCLVRINGDTVLEYSKLENLAAGPIELQAHRQGYWTEFKNIQIRKL